MQTHGADGTPTLQSRSWPFTSKRLVDELARRGHVAFDTLSAAIADATAAGRSVIAVLLERHALSDLAMRDAVSAIFALPAIDVRNEKAGVIDDDEMVELARRHQVLPLGERDGRLVVATADPTRARALTEFHRKADRQLELRIAAAGDLAWAIQERYAPRLSVKRANGRLTTVYLPPGDLTLGRADHNDLVVDDPGVSATHAVFRSEGDRNVVVDLGSRNGVFVDGERVSGTLELHNKDTILVGTTTIQFKLPKGRTGSRTEDTAKRRIRLRKAWITFAGRLIAQMLGAAALLFLGLTIGGGLPQSCSTPTDAPAVRDAAD